MRYLLRAAVATTAMAAIALTGCSNDAGRTADAASSSSASPSVVQSASPSHRTTREEVADRTRTALVKATRFERDAPGPAGHLLIEAWPDGNGADYAWETGDHRLCHASVVGDRVFQSSCTTYPNDPPVSKHRGIKSLFTSFAHGWGQIFAADHQQVTAASCGGRPVKVLRIGTVANGARTLYAVWFPNYTKGEILLTLQHGTTTSRAPFDLGDAGDVSCTANPTRPASTRS